MGGTNEKEMQDEQMPIRKRKSREQKGSERRQEATKVCAYIYIWRTRVCRLFLFISFAWEGIEALQVELWGLLSFLFLLYLCAQFFFFLLPLEVYLFGRLLLVCLFVAIHPTFLACLLGPELCLLPIGTFP